MGDETAISTRISASGSNHPRVLLFGRWDADYLVSAWRFGRDQIPAFWLEVAKRPSRRPRFSRMLTGTGFLPTPLAGTAEGLELLLQFIQTHGINALICHDENLSRWFDQNRSRFEPHCRLLIPSLAVLGFAASKRRQIGLARQSGLDVLPSWFLSGPAEVDQVPVEHFPVVVRPENFWAMRPYEKVSFHASRDSLQSFLSRCTLTEPVVVQPFRSEPNLLVHGVRSVDGRLLGMEPFLVRRKFEGVSLTVERVSLTDPALVTACERFVVSAEITGPFHFEFLFSPQSRQAWFLEINVRLGGSTSKVVRLGFDEPGLTLAAYGFDPLPPLPPLASNAVVANKRILVKQLGRALRGQLGPLDHPPVGRWGQVALSLRDLWRAHDALFNPADWGGSIRAHCSRRVH